jgi:hypothetical protein
MADNKALARICAVIFFFCEKEFVQFFTTRSPEYKVLVSQIMGS